MAQQTAVDYLFEQLWETSKDKLEWYAILSKAKQMEKEQIKDAYYYDPNTDDIKDDGEQYYNETFSNKQHTHQ